MAESKFSLPLLKMLRQTLKAHNIDILHAHTRVDIWIASLSVRGLPVNLVYTSYNYLDSTYKRDPIHRFIYGRCNLITVFSEPQRKGFCCCLPVNENMVKIIPNGIDLDRFNPETINKIAIKNSLRINPDDLVIGIVGRIMENKGQWMLIRIAKKLAKEFPRLQILFVGADSKGAIDEYFSNLLEEVKELGLDERIVFTGFRTDIPECLGILDVFVLASQAENFGTSLLEAMAMALPCIGTNSGGTPEILDSGKTGLLFEYGNLEDLFSKLYLLLSNIDLRMKLGKEARQKVKENYALDKTINSWIESYNNLIQSAVNS